MNGLKKIASKVVVCTLCDLSLKRKNSVPGTGPENAKLFIIGEAPGKYEDEKGLPFIGLSGRFLNKYLEAVGIKREDAFVTNAVKCRPPNNRKPESKEVDACRPYLIGQLSIIKPKLVLALGTSACNALGIKYKHLSDVRGKSMDLDFFGLKLHVFITFHPSFPMRFTKPRDTFLMDLKEVARLLNSQQ
jgi:DNA polymerase